MPEPRFIPLPDWREYPPAEMAERAAAFAADLSRRRTVRHFSDRDVPDGVLDDCLRALTLIRIRSTPSRSPMLPACEYPGVNQVSTRLPSRASHQNGDL